MKMRKAVLAAAIAAALGTFRSSAADDVAGNLTLFNDNAAWSWFEDERAIVDPAARQILVGSIADASGAGGASRNGRVEVASLDLATRRVALTHLGNLPADDHNTPAFLIRPDGRYLAVYAGHSSDALTRYRISTSPGDPTNWQPEQTFTNPASTTYSNVFRLSTENKTYNFTRTTGFDPNVLTSTDDGSTWAHVGKLLQDPANSDAHRPYVKYASNNTDRIHFITTEGHPRDINNGIYHGYVQAGNVYKSDGTLVGPLGSGPSAQSFSPVLAPDTVVDGTPRTHAWTTDLALDPAGRPYAAFTSRVNSDPSDHRFYYGRWDGAQWKVTELARAGGGLYAAEGDYTGLVALDPQDPDTLYISTKIDPRSQAALPFYEIFKGTTDDDGSSWSWSAVTSNSTVDNLRPIVPSWNNGKALMWLRGKYNTYTDYDLAAVGLVEQAGQQTAKLRYFDATATNTTRADGQPLTLTGPATGGGPSDGNWHQRTGFGNGGSVLTANESGAVEAVPTLKTTLPVTEAGTYDVYVMFWANPNEDWQITAGLSEDQMRVFEKDFSEQAAAADFADTGIVLTGNTVALYKAYLGRIDLTSPGDLSVFLDSSPYAAGPGSRTWYDGVALSAVTVPEPGSLGAIVATTLVIARRSRKSGGTGKL